LVHGELAGIRRQNGKPPDGFVLQLAFDRDAIDQ
jgi:hypothetical protein